MSSKNTTTNNNNNKDDDVSISWTNLGLDLDEKVLKIITNDDDKPQNNNVKYLDYMARSNNFKPFEISFKDIDSFDFEHKSFFEALISPEYVHPYFDFDEINEKNDFIDVIEWLNSLTTLFGKYSIGGYTTNEELSNEYGLKLLSEEDANHTISFHVVFYEKKILAIDMKKIMTHTEAKGFIYNGVNKFCDPNVYKLVSRYEDKSTRQLLRHPLSAKIWTTNSSNQNYKKNVKCNGSMINGSKPSQNIVTVKGSEPTITEEEWSRIFTLKEITKTKKNPEFNKTKPNQTEIISNINDNNNNNQDSITRCLGDNYEIVNDIIILNEEQLFELLCEFPKQWSQGLEIVRPILFNSPYELDFICKVMKRWYYSRLEKHNKPYPSEGSLQYVKDNSNKYFFSLIKHLDENTRNKYLSKIPLYNNVVDYSVNFEINSSFGIKDLREKDYRLPYQKYGIKVGEFLTDLRRIFVFIDCGNPTFIIKKYDALNKSYTLEYLTFQSAKELLKSINLGKCLKSYNEKTITAWDVYDAGKNKNIFRRDDMCFYSSEPNIFSYFSGYNYNIEGEVDMKIIQPFLSHIKNIICDNNAELYEYILSWFSFIVQKPSAKTGVAIVITGDQGSGKNVFTNVLCKILGSYANPNVNAIENIVGKFNTSLENKKLIICNELTSADANKYLDSDRLKSVLTEDRVELNQKCIAIRSIENVCNLIFVSNNNVPVKIEEGDRRYVVTHTSSSKIGDHKYFDSLLSGFTEEFYENLFRYFMRRDITKWNNRILPETEAKDDIVEASRSSYEMFISSCKSEFMKEVGYQTTQAYLDYQNYAKKFGYISCSLKKFGSEMKRYCDRIRKKVDSKQIYYYKLKPEYEDKIEEVIIDENIIVYDEI